jgi:signal transduction histidine kinase
MTSFSLCVLLASSLLQLVAAILAVLLIRQTTGAGHAWLLLSSAMVLMLSRRAVTLIGYFHPSVEQAFKGPIAETIALAIAILMLLGVLRVRQVFRSLQDTARELKASAEKCERLFRQAEDAVQLRDEFLAVASHELRTPVTSLQLVLQGLSSGTVADTPEARRRALGLAERQTRKLAGLIDEMLNVSCIESGQLALALTEVDLTAVAREVCERLAPALSRAACTLVLHADAPVIGRWDQGRVDQVITHLLSNAFKFAAGKPIEVQLGEVAGTARLSVRDGGSGIPPEILPRIFERFMRGVSAERYGGLGLGLYAVDSIVRSLGGTVRAESTVGIGSVFTVELPTAGPPGCPDKTADKDART